MAYCITRRLIGKEAKIFLKKLSSLLAEKWEQPYSVVCGYVIKNNGRLYY
jgi:hypothetical protein